MEAVLNLLPEPPGVEHVVIDFEAAIYIQLLMISFYIYKLNSLNKMKTCRQNSNSLITMNESIVNVLIMLAVYRHVTDNWLHLRGTLVSSPAPEVVPSPAPEVVPSTAGDVAASTVHRGECGRGRRPRQPPTSRTP